MNKTDNFKRLAKQFGSKSSSLPTQQLTTFTEETLFISQEIKLLEQFVKQSRREYVNSTRFFLSQKILPNNQPNNIYSLEDPNKEKFRDTIDTKFHKSFSILLNKLEELKEKIVHGEASPDGVECKKGILLILYQNMDKLANFYQAQRNARSYEQSLINECKLKLFRDDLMSVDLMDDLSPAKPDKVEKNSENMNAREIEAEERRKEDEDEEAVVARRHEPENIQLVMENQNLFDELESKVDKVRLVEKQVREISTLQDTFSSKVEEQAEGIESLHQTAVESKENVVKARNVLESANEHGSDLRLFILVLIYSFTVSLFFTHIYN